METNIHQLVYCSRRAVVGGDAAAQVIRDILAASHINNPSDGLTGALMSSAERFAQVLEGTADAVERAYQRIQRDDRHYDITLLLRRPVAVRVYPSWSMAYAVIADSPELVDAVLASAAADRTDAGGMAVNDLVLRSVEHARVLQNDIAAMIRNRRGSWGSVSA